MEEPDELRKAKKYEQAATLYKQLWNDGVEEANVWDGWGYAYCLRQMGEFAEAKTVCRRVLEIQPDFARAKQVLAWCIYASEVKIPNDQIRNNEQQFVHSAKSILDLVAQDQYSPYTHTIFKVIDYLKDKPTSQAANILTWLGKLNPEYLGQECLAFTDETGKRRELASHLETWFAHRTKALLDHKRYNDCRQACEQALSKVASFHYDNDVWFRWRIALCDVHTGQREEAIEKLKELARRKREWFIEYELAELLFNLGRTEEALVFAVSAALGHGEDKMKGKLYLLLGEISEAQQETERAQQHILLAMQIYSDEGWKLPASHQELATRLEVNLTSDTNRGDLKRSLVSYWKEVQEAHTPRQCGTIKVILPNGNAGFIRTKDGLEYHFSIASFKGRREQAVQGACVCFQLIEGYDRKKNIEALQAVNVTLCP